MKSCFALLLILVSVCCVNSANILGIFPTPTKSHHILGSALLKELAKRGHNITMISPFPFETPPQNYHDINLDGFLETKEEIMEVITNPNSTFLEKWKNMFAMIRFQSTDVLEHKNVHAFLSRNETFDLCIMLWGMATESLLGIGHSVQAKTIGFGVIGSMYTLNYRYGNPASYSYVPHFLTPYRDEMNLLQRVVNTIANVLGDLSIIAIDFLHTQNVYSKYFPNGPPLASLVEDVDITLINSHYSTETPRPLLPNLIQIGGFHLQEQEDLPAELKKYLDKSAGVIYFSLGTNVKSSNLPQDTINGILTAFAQLKYDILWKIETDLQNKPKNVKISNWLPQRAILNHPNVKAFITHGGFGSITEAIYHGVPMVCIPFFADQEQNVAEVVYAGFALRISKTNLTGSTLVTAINEITTNPEYSEKIKLKSDLFKNQEMNPMEKAVFWVEHAIKHKNVKHLKAKAATLPWYQYMLLDVFSFIVIVLLGTLYSFYYIMKTIINLSCRKRNIKFKKQ